MHPTGISQGYPAYDPTTPLYGSLHTIPLTPAGGGSGFPSNSSFASPPANDGNTVAVSSSSAPSSTRSFLASWLPVCCQFQFVVPSSSASSVGSTGNNNNNSNANSRSPPVVNTEVHPQAGSPPFTYPPPALIMPSPSPQGFPATYNSHAIVYPPSPQSGGGAVMPIPPRPIIVNEFTQSYGLSTATGTANSSSLAAMQIGSSNNVTPNGVMQSPDEFSADESMSRRDEMARKKSVTFPHSRDGDGVSRSSSRKSITAGSTSRKSRSNPGSVAGGPAYKRDNSQVSSPAPEVKQAMASPPPAGSKQPPKSLPSKSSSSSMLIRKSEKNQNIKAKDKSEWERGNACCVCKQKFGLFGKAHHCRKCGKTVCENCSKKTVLMHDAKGKYASMERACDTCYNEVHGLDDMFSKPGGDLMIQSMKMNFPRAMTDQHPNFQVNGSECSVCQQDLLFGDKTHCGLCGKFVCEDCSTSKCKMLDAENEIQDFPICDPCAGIEQQKN
eukprot:TRINITY_DN27187_c0_g1_i1.p1 TRINITY_DN27187_c0_g1~~TRINITY_DN27187_c0_g1_i1.p1  ORF type:complete len:498 (-),score=86.05 TRINITY_DN27187_c0_g1_i1:109-1602(-)